MNMLEVQPQDFTFIKEDKDWQIGGSIRLVLNDGLKTVDEALYSFLEELFPKTGEQRYLEGRIGYDSQALFDSVKGTVGIR